MHGVATTTRPSDEVPLLGNNEWVSLPFDTNQPYAWQHLIEASSTNNVIRRLRAACTYLENQSVELCGLNIYGSPCSTRTSGLYYVNPRDDGSQPTPYVDFSRIPTGILTLMCYTFPTSPSETMTILTHPELQVSISWYLMPRQWGR